MKARVLACLLISGMGTLLACDNLNNPAAPTEPLGGTEAESELELSAQLEIGYRADAYGTRVQVGTTVTSDKTAPVALACAAQPTTERSNTVATVDLTPFGQTAAVSTTAAALTLSGGGTAARSTSSVHRVNLLNGRITADEVTAVSQTRLRSTGFSTSAAGSGFVNLRVDGLSINANVAPNTKIELPGLGYVVLNEQQSRTRSEFGDLTVTMIRVVIDQENDLRLPLNSRILVAVAHSRIQRPGWTCACEGPLTGFAFGSLINGQVLKSGKTALVNLPCDGTDGQVRTKTVLTVEVDDVMQLGQVVNTAEGTVENSSVHGKTTSTVESVNLLNGLITAEVIRAVTEVRSTGGAPAFNTTGTAFVGLHVEGHPGVDATVSANTRIELSGLGTLWLRRVVQTSRGIEVRMIELIIEESNEYGIDVGSRIVIADSKVGVKS